MAGYYSTAFNPTASSIAAPSSPYPSATPQVSSQARNISGSYSNPGQLARQQVYNTGGGNPGGSVTLSQLGAAPTRHSAYARVGGVGAVASVLSSPPPANKATSSVSPNGLSRAFASRSVSPPRHIGASPGNFEDTPRYPTPTRNVSGPPTRSMASPNRQNSSGPGLYSSMRRGSGPSPTGIPEIAMRSQGASVISGSQQRSSSSNTRSCQHPVIEPGSNSAVGRALAWGVPPHFKSSSSAGTSIPVGMWSTRPQSPLVERQVAQPARASSIGCRSPTGNQPVQIASARIVGEISLDHGSLSTLRSSSIGSRSPLGGHGVSSIGSARLQSPQSVRDGLSNGRNGAAPVVASRLPASAGFFAAPRYSAERRDNHVSMTDSGRVLPDRREDPMAQSDRRVPTNQLDHGAQLLGEKNERPNPFLALLPKETRDMIDRISGLLRDRDILKTHVVQIFKMVVTVPDDGLDDEYDLGEMDMATLQSFRDLLAKDLQLPADAFGDLEVDHNRFDFTGTGNLSLNEAYKLVKFHLREYRKQLGGAPVTVDIPFRSLQMAGYTITKELGVGSQGTAKLASNRTGNDFCIKCYRKDKMNVGGVEELKEEFEALRLLHCDNIAGAFEMFQDAQHFYMVGEAFYGGDLLTLKKRARAQNVQMEEPWWRDLFKQIFEALAFMHKNAMIHCDIKEPNIMIKTADMQFPKVVVIDLGVARAMAASDSGIPHGTPGYVPPETWETKKWFPTGDIFSLGVVIVQLMTDKCPPVGPRNKDTPGGIFVEGCSNVRDIFLATQSRPAPLHLMPPDMPDLQELAGRCLEKKMSERPKSVEALKDPFFTSTAHRRKSSIPLDLNPRNRFATTGITKSFLMNLDNVEEDDETETPKRKRGKHERKEKRKPERDKINVSDPNAQNLHGSVANSAATTVNASESGAVAPIAVADQPGADREASIEAQPQWFTYKPTAQNAAAVSPLATSDRQASSPVSPPPSASAAKVVKRPLGQDRVRPAIKSDQR